MRVLIVEDDLVSQTILKKTFAAYGTTDIAADGKEAVQAFQLALEGNAPYDLVCLDILMPHMDGHEALRNFREMEKTKGIRGKDETKVIMISALGDPRSVVRAYYEGGATSYLTKPFDLDTLLAIVEGLGLI
jgi:two-component system chemotaxis response regulator CheY